MNKVRLEILGLSASPASNGAYALLLKEANGERRLPIIIGATEAQAIAVEIDRFKAPRPMTHDLIKSIIESFGGTVQEVTIVDLQDSTFYANITIEGAPIDIDARPSDAIAIAVRFEAPIFILENILDEAGIQPEPSEDGEADGEEDNELFDLINKAQEPEPEAEEEDIDTTSQFSQLQSQLKKAIKDEDYEKAAQIRDQLQKYSDNSDTL